MTKFIQKLVILWEKSKFLTLMELESNYLKTVHSDILNRDVDMLRDGLRALKELKKPTSKNQQDIVEIESQINETEKFRQMIKSSEEKAVDLKKQIEIYKAGLWKS